MISVIPMLTSNLFYWRSLTLIAISCTALLWSFSASALEPTLSALDIIKRVSIHADDYWDESRDYTFLIDILVDDYEADGSLKEQTTLTERLYHFYGRRFFKQLTINGEPLKGEALEEENTREAEFRNQTEEALASADSSDLNGRMDRTAIKIVDLVDRYTYELAGTDTLEGRDVYVVHFTPKPDLDAETRRDKIFNALAGTAWIDTVQFRIVKANGRLVDNVRIGWIAANITEVNINYGQQEITPGVWMPSYVRAKVVGSIFFFKKINRYTSANFYEFTKTEEAPAEFFEGFVMPTEDKGASRRDH